MKLVFWNNAYSPPNIARILCIINVMTWDLSIYKQLPTMYQIHLITKSIRFSLFWSLYSSLSLPKKTFLKRHKGYMALRNLTPLIQSKSFKKLWNLGQTSAGFCLAKGKKYMEQLCDKSTTLKKEYVCHSLSAQLLFKGLFIQCIVTGSIHEMQSKTSPRHLSKSLWNSISELWLWIMILLQ